MNKKRFTFITTLIVLALALSACATLPALSSFGKTGQNNWTINLPKAAGQVAPTATLAPAPAAGSAAPVASENAAGLLAAYEGTLENVYEQVNPSVVNIRVIVGSSAISGSQELPFGLPGQDGANPPMGQALGSGFVWDTEGHIVTNNHVVENATEIDVNFSEGTTLSAKLVGNDPSSDLAVIKVENAPAGLLKPVALADSAQLKVGQIAIAIGNPFGLNGTMTVGIISALGRSLDANGGSLVGASYQMPNIIQTDAPINPGNSGGVLVNDQGQVIGVTTAIQSSTNSSAGIGFVVPSNTVRKEVPTLIQTGQFEHPYLGISGTTLTPELTEAMNLNTGTRGAMVAEVVEGGPAAQAGLQPASRQATIEGQPVSVGGDVITAIDGQAIKSMDDLISYLADNTTVGQKVAITVLRDGQEKTVEVTLKARPTTNPVASALPNQGNQENPFGNLPGFGQGDQGNQGQQPANRARLGISGLSLTPEIAQAMNLPQNTQGVLVMQIQPGSGAEKAGLRAGSNSFNLNGETLLIGGDVITAVEGTPVTGINELVSLLAQNEPGQVVSLSIPRDGKTQQVEVTLGSAN
ncbi:MAG: PDZ domain-containing protein [Chloroflexi bacterium]|nr:MAG: PDZ domain-containing protein [Chloroflexota bacterium]